MKTEEISLREETFEIVRATLTKHDPEGLLRMGAPADEYDSEAKQISDAICRGEEPSAELVRRVWEKAFWYTDRGPYPMCPVFEAVAEQIRDLTKGLVNERRDQGR